MNDLCASIEFSPRFSELDPMNVVWHGAYPLYLEDAREAFGAKYGIGYQTIADSGCFAPLVELTFKYLNPIRYGQRCRVDIFYRPTASAKMVFDYEIRSVDDNRLMTTAHSVQVFMDRDYRLLWYKPEFFEKWEQGVGVRR